MLILAVIIVSAWNYNDRTAAIHQDAANVRVAKDTGKQKNEPIEEQYDTNNWPIYYVTIVDTGFDYFKLDTKMSRLSKRTGIPVDTMNRFYNKSKNLIALPDDDEDEIYAGDYFPRRYPSINLSLEYLDVYKQPAHEKTIALVSGIFETRKSADSMLAIVKPKEPKAFVARTRMYVGCMH
jgi:hypothetical protein